MRWNFIIFLFFLFKCYQCVEYRLPKTLSPTHYDIRIITHLDESIHPFRFVGEVRILVSIHFIILLLFIKCIINKNN